MQESKKNFFDEKRQTEIDLQDPIFAIVSKRRGLEIAFENRTLRDICENEVVAKRRLGEKAATKLKARLADFRAASCVDDVIIGRVRNIAAQETVTISLPDRFQIVFCANHTNNPLTANANNLDWSKVTRIKILKIENDHS